MTAKPDAGTILVVDDDEQMRGLIARMVKGFGYTAIQAADGSEAIHAYSANFRDIVAATLDLDMPTTNGREVLAMLSEYAPKLPIVIATGLELSKVQLIGRVPGTRGVTYLKKPFQSAELKDALDRAIQTT
jgi:CheY-like chemotaxis protein